MKMLKTLAAALLLAVPSVAAAQAVSSPAQQVQGPPIDINRGNPVKTGCVYNTVTPTATDTKVIECQADVGGAIRVTATTGTGSSASQVQGTVAHDGVDANNPVGIGGYASASAPTAVADADRVRAWFDNRGNIRSLIVGSAGASADAYSSNIARVVESTGSVGYNLATGPFLFNGASYDRQRGNLDSAALITAAGATTSQTGADQTNYNGKCLNVVLDMTDVGTGSVTVTIQGKDAASGKYYPLLTGAAVTTNSTNAYFVCPGTAVAANVSSSYAVPRTWRVITIANNANATTYTVGASLTN